MKTLPELFQGVIAQDFQEILYADLSPDAGLGEVACKAKTPSKTDTLSPQCTTLKKKCKGKKKRKAAAFLPAVPGWCSPPAPPAF